METSILSVDFEAPKNFKTYEKLKERLNLVLQLNAAPTPVDESEEEVLPTPSTNWGAEVSNFREKAVASTPVDTEEDALSYLNLLKKNETALAAIVMATSLTVPARQGTVMVESIVTRSARRRSMKRSIVPLGHLVIQVLEVRSF